MLFEKRSDLARIVSNNLLEDRHQDAGGVVADDRSLRYLSNIFGLGRGNREAAAVVYVKRDVDIGAAVANVDDVVVGEAQPELQLIDCDYLTVTRRRNGPPLRARPTPRRSRTDSPRFRFPIRSFVCESHPGNQARCYSVSD